MARLPRIVLLGIPQHIIQRGNNRQAVFFKDADYRLYLDALHEAAERYGCAIHAFVLMTNHVHVLATPSGEHALSRLMQSVGQRYARHVNTTYNRTGTLWEGRFKSAVVESDRYLLACMRYIELNPVRARMVDTAAAYRWSSHGANGQGMESTLVTPHAVYHALGASDAIRQKHYLELFTAGVEPDEIDRIRSATRNGEVIGSAQYCERMVETLGRRVIKSGHGGDRRSSSFRGAGASSALTP